MPSLQKMTQHTGKPMPHTGNMIRKIMEEQHFTTADLARIIDCCRTTMVRCLLQPTTHAALLWKIGQELNHDFFADLSAAFPQSPAAAPVPTAKELALQQQVDDLQKEVEMYEKVLRLIKG